MELQFFVVVSSFECPRTEKVAEDDECRNADSFRRVDEGARPIASAGSSRRSASKPLARSNAGRSCSRSGPGAALTRSRAALASDDSESAAAELAQDLESTHQRTGADIAEPRALSFRLRRRE
jgi:hypothetical protein